ncbi:pheromone shutdown-related protein TraB [Natronospira proteinivora]|uniref:Pheromone shutdown-related protein TraB n=1 Tax=Natronospira proteinivora TaxID=1807133 RepID=A0ABT1GAM9_9GAMM|nr:TraB/GumN family protein [Natronospira proteinivora]MCP1728384.1 pheromone shutdown-related protein TraB [Natronospira proteinivora]
MPQTRHAEGTNTPAQGPREIVERDGVRFTLLGTAHVSRASAEEARQMAGETRFDAVAVELCETRRQAMRDPEHLAKLDLFQVFREGKAGMVAATLALGAYQRRLSEQLGSEPGAEMRWAEDAARERQAPVWLVDREVGITLRRVYRSQKWWQRLPMIAGLFTSLLSREKVDAQQIEQLKEGDVVESSFRELAEQSPALHRTLVEERDHYMAQRLLSELENSESRPREVLVVVGAGHLKGLADALKNQARDAQREAELATTPPPARWPRYLPWVVVAIILSGFALGFARSPELGLRMFGDWVLINGGLSALGAAAALAHPLTILGSMLAAPLTSLNPTIGAGFVAAAIELSLRRPRVADFQGLRDQVVHWSGWWRNRVARTLLVFLFVSLGSAAGTYLGGFRVFEHLFSA